MWSRRPSSVHQSARLWVWFPTAADFARYCWQTSNRQVRAPGHSHATRGRWRILTRAGAPASVEDLCSRGGVMSLHAPLAYSIPDETARVARAAFPKGNPYLRVRDALGPIYTNPEFADLFPNDGSPAEAP